MVESKPTSADSSRIKFNNIFDPIDLTQRRTKIVCTLGPSCWDVDKLVLMLDRGMNVARLNFSHGDHKVSVEFVTRNASFNMECLTSRYFV